MGKIYRVTYRKLDFAGDPTKDVATKVFEADCKKGARKFIEDNILALGNEIVETQELVISSKWKTKNLYKGKKLDLTKNSKKKYGGEITGITEDSTPSKEDFEENKRLHGGEASYQ